MSEKGSEQSSGWPALSIAEAHARLTAPGERFEMEQHTIRGVPLRVWKHAPPTLRDVFLNARGYAARTALVYEADRTSYAGFARAVSVLAAELRSQGLQKGDRVAIIMRNLPEWPVSFFAAALCGAIVTPCNAWWTGPELRFALQDSGARFAIVDPERCERLTPHLAECPALERLYVARSSERQDVVLPVGLLQVILGPVAGWETLPEQPLPDVALAPEDDATIFYTSGTTGTPKGALGTHRNACSNTLTTACAQARAFLRRGEQPKLPGPDSPQRALLLAVPLFHVLGCMPWMVAGINNGSKLVLMRKWDPAHALALIQAERITQAGGVPTLAWDLLAQPDRERFDLSSLDAINCGGAPAAPELVRRLREAFPQARPANGWGMTEVTSSYASNNAEDYAARPSSCGVAAPTNDWKIMSADGSHELPIGEVGELWVKGPQVVKGYWNRPAETAATFVEGWLKTGDLARLDEEGFGYVVDRSKDMLIRGGENIHCVEVENVLFEHPDVLDAALIGVPHETLGEEAVAIVQAKQASPALVDALRALVGARLAPFKVPSHVVFWTEALPRNEAGKVLKNQLRREVVAKLSAR
ncbi:MAG: class I adenylate-forming enzyme family protein [Polyangiales bacterium]